MGEVKSWNHFSRLYETKRYESIMYACILKSQYWPCGVSDFFFFSCGGEVSPSVKGIGFPYCSSSPCGSALMLVPCPQLWDPRGALGICFSTRWGQSRLLCVLLRYYWCPTTVLVQWKSRKSERAHVDIGCSVSFLVYIHLWISLLAYIVLCWKISFLVPSGIAGVNL